MDTLGSAITKMNHYSELTAQAKYARGERGSVLQGLLRGFWTFIRTYVLRGGFLDGRQGFLLATTNAGGTFLKYAKLSMMRSSVEKR